MSDGSDVSVTPNIYDEDLTDETKMDVSARCLDCVPEIKNRLLCALYLQNNNIRLLPADFFPSLPKLMWLDLRENHLTEIPETIRNHECLTHLLLQSNRITSLPDELGSVGSLRVLQLSGNPIIYPPREIINAGVPEIINFLHNKYLEGIFTRSQSDSFEDEASINENYQEAISYNSVLDVRKVKTLSVQFSGKVSGDFDDESSKGEVKCPKLPKSRSKTLPLYCQSSKYVKPLRSDSRSEQNEKIKRCYFKEITLKKHIDLLASMDKILQSRKNLENIKKWRQNYRYKQQTVDSSYRLDPKLYPYDTNPEHMRFLTKEDIEKDLPDKYKRKLVRRCKPTVPRKSNNDVHLALKIKQLFENLEAIDLNRQDLTPRTEQKVLFNEIQKISEIKQKLMELSTVNTRSVTVD